MMKNDIFKGKKFSIAYTLGLTAFTAYALLDAFVIPRSYSGVVTKAEAAANAESGTITIDRSVFETAKGSDESSSDSKISDEMTNGSEDDGTTDDISVTENQDSSSQKTAGKPSGKSGDGSSGHGGRGKPGQSSASRERGKASGSQSETSKAVEGNDSETNTASEPETTTIETVSSDTIIGSYEDSVKTITLSEYRAADTSIYVADVQLTGDATEEDETAFSASDLIKTAFAEDTYGKNVKAATSETAAANDAILAINGDFYGAQNSGYVIRNGVLYRSESSGNEDLAILADGTFEIFSENDLSAEEVLNAGAVDVLSFGPGLVEEGEIAVTEDEEVGKAMASNPRTAIGILEDGHYVWVVTDGRTDESEGLTLYQLAEFMQSLGCTTAYNLDGGGSSTMYFNGQVVNNPTTGGNSIKERSVSDIIYIGK